ncbi:MAG: double zinc ribbon domain-containing protein [Capsulimonadaceae bacterium]
MPGPSSFVDPILSLLYPPKCAVCRRLGEPVLCERCRNAVTAVTEPICALCGQSLGEHTACSHCTLRRPAFDAARALGAYEGTLKHAIHLLKYRDRPALADPLGVLLAEYARNCAPALDGLAFDRIVPVPMHAARRRVRGYNQSERIARSLGRELTISVDVALLRRRGSRRPQVGLSQDARRQNLLDAFAVVDPARAAGRSFLLVDDVSTTGTTLHECAKALKAAGAKAVYGLTLAAG